VNVTQESGNRRIDRIRRLEYLEGLPQLSLDEVRSRRDECRAELEYLSYLRRQVQGRAEILKAEVDRRRSPDDGESLVDKLAEILAPEEGRSAPSRGGAVQVGLPEEELLLARRRVERLVADTTLSDPASLSDGELDGAVEVLLAEERTVSTDRGEVIRVLDTVQDELKRRYKDDVSQVLS
jgi:anti-sigma-K factor RsiG